jgi:putative heme transporter
MAKSSHIAQQPERIWCRSSLYFGRQSNATSGQIRQCIARLGAPSPASDRTIELPGRSAYCRGVSEENGPRKVTHDISTAGLLKVCAVAGGVWLLIRLWPIVLVLVVTLILVGTMSPAVTALERRGFTRNRALVFVFVSMALFTGIAAALTIPAMGRELVEIVEHAPQLQARMAAVLERSRITRSLAPTVRAFRVDQVLLKGNAEDTFALSERIVELVGYFFTTVVLAVYLTAGRDHARGVVYAWVPRRFHVRLARITLNLEVIVGGYMRGQLITSAAIAVFAFVLLTALRLPNALALAVFAGFSDVIPFVGGFLATAPATLAALPHGVGQAAIVCGAMLMYQQFESRVLVPRVYGRALRLSPTAVLLALLVGGKLLGILGALLALPVAAGIRMVLEELRVELPGDDSDDSALRARDARAERVYEELTHGADPEEAAAVAVEVANEIRRADAESLDPGDRGAAAVAAVVPITDGKR